MNDREQKALAIAARSKVSKKGDVWLVPSQSNSGCYVVASDLQNCTCPDYQSRQLPCKHILAAEIVVEREQSVIETRDGQTTTTTVTETVKVRYKQVWAAYNSAQTNEKSKFLELLNGLCANVDEPIQLMGRTRHPMSDMLFSTIYKVYSAVSSRRFMTDLKDAYTRRYISKLPSFNSISQYLDKPEITPYLQWLITQSSLPLKAVESDFAVDSSGFSTCQYVRWFDEKYGKTKAERDWVKAHIMVGTTTNVVTSAEISGAHGADHTYFAPLVNETAKRFDVKEVSADKAYSSYANLTVVDNKGAVPYIDFKSNASGKSKNPLWNRTYLYYNLHRDDFKRHYHRRSNVETTFHMIKSKFGSFVRSKLPAAQVNEVLAKIVAHNICCLIQSMYELGIDVKF